MVKGQLLPVHAEADPLTRDDTREVYHTAQRISYDSGAVRRCPVNRSWQSHFTYPCRGHGFRSSSCDNERFLKQLQGHQDRVDRSMQPRTSSRC